MAEIPLIAWVIFNLFIVAMLVLDLKVFHRKPHEIRMKEALGWSAFWIALALLFNAGIYLWRGPQTGLEFLTGYLIEKSLSVDNIFVFLLIFSYFKVPALYQHKILFWGIMGALILRLVFILSGVALINRFHWTIYVFGAFLILTGIKLAFEKDKEIHPERNPVLRLFRRWMPVTKQYEGARFFVKEAGRRFATPLFVVLLVVETTDVVFAVDSVPAILAITRDPFIVYSSNVFAILGLRALYFALAGLMQLFHHLHYGLSAILVFVGTKMLLADLYKIPIGVALGAVAGILTLSILASLIFKKSAQEDSGNSRSKETAPMTRKFGKVFICLVGVIVLLAVVIFVSIRRGVSAQHALTAIRVAQLDEAHATRIYRDVPVPKSLEEARKALFQAYEFVGAGRYKEAISVSAKARRLAEESIQRHRLPRLENPDIEMNRF